MIPRQVINDGASDAAGPAGDQSYLCHIAASAHVSTVSVRPGGADRKPGQRLDF
jgi:hypothetical protein